MSKDEQPCCVLILNTAEAACLSGNIVVTLLKSGSEIEKAFGVDMRQILDDP